MIKVFMFLNVTVNGEMVNGPVGSPIRNSHSSHNSHTNPPYSTGTSRKLFSSQLKIKVG